MSKVYGVNGGFTIVYGARIENAVCGSGKDLILGNEYDSPLEGGEGRDTLIGGNVSDLLYGGNGADSLSGDPGYNLLCGEAGADALSAGNGADLRYGGAGSDRFIFTSIGNFRASGGAATVDYIDDFRTGGDKLDFRTLAKFSFIGNGIAFQKNGTAQLVFSQLREPCSGTLMATASRISASISTAQVR